MNLSQTYYLELISLRQQIKICSSQDVCRNDEVVMFRRLAERCEEDKIKIREKSNHLYEKYQKLHNEKHSFFSESNSLLKNISHQCSTDVNSLDQFMSKFEISVTGLTNFQSSIMLDISKDKIEKNKIIENIKLKKDENTRIKNQYTEMQKEIKFIEKNILELIEKLKKTSDKNQIIILVKQIEEEEKRNKDKNSKLISFIERINKTQIDLNVMGNEIKSLNSLINFRNDKHKVIKNIYTNVENSKTDIKKFIDTKKTITEEAFTKIKNYKKTVIAEDPLISILKKEKNDSNDMVKKIENMNKKLEQTIVDLKKKINISEVSGIKVTDLTKSFKDGTIMNIFGNKEFVTNNCDKISAFTTKLTQFCKNNEEFDLSPFTPSLKITKRKNQTNIIDKNPVKILTDIKKDTKKIASELKDVSDKIPTKASDIESKTKYIPIPAHEKGDPTKHLDIESKNKFIPIPGKIDLKTHHLDIESKSNIIPIHAIDATHHLDIESQEKLKDIESKTKIK